MVTRPAPTTLDYNVRVFFRGTVVFPTCASSKTTIKKYIRITTYICISRESPRAVEVGGRLGKGLLSVVGVYSQLLLYTKNVSTRLWAKWYTALGHVALVAGIRSRFFVPFYRFSKSQLVQHHACLVSPHGSLDRLKSLYSISSSLYSKRQTTQALGTR